MTPEQHSEEIEYCCITYKLLPRRLGPISLSGQIAQEAPTLGFSFITARCTLVQSAVLRSHVVCLSVCLSVCDVGEL